MPRLRTGNSRALELNFGRIKSPALWSKPNIEAILTFNSTVVCLPNFILNRFWLVSKASVYLYWLVCLFSAVSSYFEVFELLMHVNLKADIWRLLQFQVYFIGLVVIKCHLHIGHVQERIALWHLSQRLSRVLRNRKGFIFVVNIAEFKPEPPGEQLVEGEEHWFLFLHLER